MVSHSIDLSAYISYTWDLNSSFSIYWTFTKRKITLQSYYLFFEIVKLHIDYYTAISEQNKIWKKPQLYWLRKIFRVYQCGNDFKIMLNTQIDYINWFLAFICFFFWALGNLCFFAFLCELGTNNFFLFVPLGSFRNFCFLFCNLTF